MDRKDEGAQFTTAETMRMKRTILDRMRERNQRGDRDPSLVPERTALEVAERHPHLNQGQRQAVEAVLQSRAQIVGLDGVAGAGKTTALAVVREGAEAAGYAVGGFAPTSRAAQKLAEAGIETMTLQAHLARGQRANDGERRLYVVDESSLASTKQMHDFVTRLHPSDRVLLVGDTRQHESVEPAASSPRCRRAGCAPSGWRRSCARKTPS